MLNSKTFCQFEFGPQEVLRISQAQTRETVYGMGPPKVRELVLSILLALSPQLRHSLRLFGFVIFAFRHVRQSLSGGWGLGFRVVSVF